MTKHIVGHLARMAAVLAIVLAGTSSAWATASRGGTCAAIPAISAVQKPPVDGPAFLASPVTIAYFGEAGGNAPATAEKAFTQLLAASGGEGKKADDTPAAKDKAQKLKTALTAVLSLANEMAANIQKGGPKLLLDGNGCEWSVSAGSDLLALWSVSPTGFRIYFRPVAPWPKPTKQMKPEDALAAAQPLADGSWTKIPLPPAKPPAGGDGDKTGDKTQGCFPFTSLDVSCSAAMRDTAENIALANISRLRDTIGGPSVSIGPAKSGTTASYDYQAQAALALVYKWNCSQTDAGNGCPGLLNNRYIQNFSAIFAPFASIWYGSEKKATGGGGSNLLIDRLSLGAVFAESVGFDLGGACSDCKVLSRQQEIYEQENSIQLAFQLIPQFITDHRFEAKIAYIEGRTDIEQAPIPCFHMDFDGINDGNLGELGNITCGAGVIMDYAHQVKAGLQSSLTNSFARLGYEVGATYQPVTDCDGYEDDGCSIMKNISFQVGYRNLWDYLGQHANVYRFTSTLKYTFGGKGGGGGGKGLSVGLTYTDGIEDITLAPIPTWKLSLSGQL